MAIDSTPTLDELSGTQPTLLSIGLPTEPKILHSCVYALHSCSTEPARSLRAVYMYMYTCSGTENIYLYM